MFFTTLGLGQVLFFDVLSHFFTIVRPLVGSGTANIAGRGGSLSLDPYEHDWPSI